MISEFSLKNKFLITFIILFFLILGIYYLFKIPIDAIPDISENQVIITVKYEGQDPQTIDEQISYPIVSKLLSVPNVAFIYVIFNENVDLYWARGRVLEYLSGFKFPEGVSFQIGADASAISWIFQYVLVSNKHTIDELTSFNEFFLKPYLQSIEGVSEVGTIGGFLKEYQIDLNPYLMKAYDISFEDVLNAIKNNNQSTGGRYIEISERFYNIRGYGYVKSLEDIENISVKNSNGKSVKIKDIAIVQLGTSLREGALDFNGKDESVGGIIISRIGENSYNVIKRVKEKIKHLNLPDWMEIKIAYDRSHLIEESIKTLIISIIKESLIIAFMILIFLFSIRSSISIILMLSISIIISFIFLKIFNITLNIYESWGIYIITWSFNWYGRCSCRKFT